MLSLVLDRIGISRIGNGTHMVFLSNSNLRLAMKIATKTIPCNVPEFQAGLT